MCKRPFPIRFDEDEANVTRRFTRWLGEAVERGLAL